MLAAQHLPLLAIPSWTPAPDAHPSTVPRASHTFLLDRLVAHSVSPLSHLSPVTVEDDDPASPSGPNYHYAPRASPDPYDPYPTPYPYAASSDLRRARAPSPAPQDTPVSAPAPLPANPNASASAPHSQDRFSFTALDRQKQSSIIDRRMSDPAVPYPSPPRPQQQQQYRFTYDAPPHSPDSPFLLSRTTSLGSIRQTYSPTSMSHAEWKQDLSDSVSPFQPSFSSVLTASPPLQYTVHGAAEDAYGPSPPGTATSSSSTTPTATSASAGAGAGSLPPLGPDDSANAGKSKTYSFVALPGNTVRKRPRRRYDEIERLYQCAWPDCNKAYGTLNHLNAHVQMQKHGPKRSPNEFKELRKQWRKAKKEFESPTHAHALGFGADLGAGGDSAGPMRRSMSMNPRRDDLFHHPYAQHHRSFSGSALSPPLGVAIPQMRQQDVYGGYVPQSPQTGAYGHGLDFRAVQGQGSSAAGTPASWPPAGGGAGRAEMYASPLSTHAHSAYPYHGHGHAQMLEGTSASGDAYPGQSPTRATLEHGRLPPNSMLLTPLVASGQGDAYGHGGGGYYDDKAGSGDEY